MICRFFFGNVIRAGVGSAKRWPSIPSASLLRVLGLVPGHLSGLRAYTGVGRQLVART